MARRKWLGDKTGQGFYKKVKGEGEREILTLDLNTMDYRPRQKAKFASLEMGKTIEDTRERLRALLLPILLGQPADKAQQFLWGSLSEMCLYAARRVPEISDSVEDVDRAMRWGFGWELGPFEMMDALGVPVFAGRSSRKAARFLRSWKNFLPMAAMVFITRPLASCMLLNPTARPESSKIRPA